MKKPSELMKRALQRSRWKTLKLWKSQPVDPNSMRVTFKGQLADPVAHITGHRSHEETITATIGESFTWTLDEDGDAVEMLGVSEGGLPMYSGKLNEEQKERWKRITG